MKPTVIKQNKEGLIAAILVGGLAVTTLAYLYLTKSGDDVRGNLKKKAKDLGKDLAAGAVSKKTGISKKKLRKVADHFIK